MLKYDLEEVADPHILYIADFDEDEYEKTMKSEVHDMFIPLNDKELKITFGIKVDKSECEHLNWEETEVFR